MIVGTAGHIDHGKTALVRALTGVDTDRLPEEKARGITIDLGYAYASMHAAPSLGPVIGFVDVPGHEQLVRTMVAGATGIDYALLVVAADDGVMPQTREHLNILALLGVEHGAVVITKCDLVEPARIHEVTHAVVGLLAATTLAACPVLHVSTRTGSGMQELKDALAAAAVAAQGAPADAAQRKAFRLAVDRSFTLAGAGTVVTGSVYSGHTTPGARLTIVPAQRSVRLRELHAQNHAATRTTVGERSALNLADIARTEVGRGDWVVDPAIALATQRLDARCVALPDAGRALRSGASVHLYVGAAHVTARVIVLAAHGQAQDDAALQPGTPTLVQLVSDAPLAAWHGDRFIVRDAGDARTLGGGTVLDPFAPARYRRTPARLAVLSALAVADDDARLAALLELQDEGVDLVEFARASARLPESLALAAGVHRVRHGDMDHALSATAWQLLLAMLQQRLATFHAQHPDEMGPDAKRLQRIALPRLAPAVFAALVDAALNSGALRQSGPWLHLPAHDNRFSDSDQALFNRMLPLMQAQAFDPPWVRDHAKHLGQAEQVARALLNRAAKRGEVFQVVRDLFYHADAVRKLADIAAALQDSEGQVTASAFRDRTGVGRKRAIQILEFFDRVAFTRRVRDAHHVRSDALRRIGAALPLPGDRATPPGAGIEAVAIEQARERNPATA